MLGKHKPLSFSTTMRNPERIAPFLECIAPYEGEKLTSGCINSIVRDVIRKKLYVPLSVKRDPKLKAIENNDDESFSEEQLSKIIAISPQKHKEAGFEAGWPSRFDTWYKLQKEFGFLWYEPGERIVLSHTGHMLVEAARRVPADNLKIQNIFLNAMVKYRSDNPFRKTLNSNVPLLLVLRTIRRIKDLDPKVAGLYRAELSFLICWPDENVERLCDFIIGPRKKYKVSGYTDEIIYNLCLNILGYGEKEKKYIKMKQVTGEAVDDYIRKMKITGILSLRGNGRFLDYNNLEQEKINYILSAYPRPINYRDDKEYFEYMGEVDESLLIHSGAPAKDSDKLRKERLEQVAREYTIETIFKELVSVCRKRESKDPLFKFISAPARLEFLTSIALVQNFEGLNVYPHYVVDDEGLPTFTAPGGISDIECRDQTYEELVEVSLGCSHQQQVNDEMLPIVRHLTEVKKKHNLAFSIFVAPKIHPDAKLFTEFIKYKQHLDIKAFDIENFISAIKDEPHLSDLMKINSIRIKKDN